MPKFEQFLLPDVGEGLTEAEIVQWIVAVGASVEINQTIVEIETAKSLVELPSPYAGVVAEILVEEGATVDVGTPIITIDVDPMGTVLENGGGLTLDADGTQSEGKTIDESKAADILAAQTLTNEEESGAVLVGYGVTEAPETPAVQRRRKQRRAAEAATVDATAAPEAGTTTTPDSGTSSMNSTSTTYRDGDSPGASVLAKPPVRKLARDLGIDLNAVMPTGPGGIVTREDILAQVVEAEPEALATYPGDDQPWLESGQVSADGRETRVPVKSVRKRTAEAMVTSAFTAPHVTVFHTLDVTKTMKLVNRLKQDREFSDVRVSPLLIVAKALLLAVRRNPEINASWNEEDQEIIYKHFVNLGIAAATPRGLVVPNIKDAHRLGLHDLAVSLADLTATARSGKTSPLAMSGGTITITNVGVFGIDTGTPILNPGEAAILAFGAIQQQPWIHKGKVRSRYVTQLALSFDHRLVDGALGSRVLADVATVLAEPSQGLVWS